MGEDKRRESFICISVVRRDESRQHKSFSFQDGKGQPEGRTGPKMLAQKTCLNTNISCLFLTAVKNQNLGLQREH